MIMPRGEQLLMPANPWFIGLSLFFALVLNLLPSSSWIWMPDFLMLVLGFWAVHQPYRIGLAWSFVLGLCMDVQHAALLGQTALAYVLVVFIAQYNSRRLVWFSSVQQGLQMLPVFALAHFVQMLVHMLAGDMFPGLWLALAPVLEALLWPVALMLLQAPQRRAPQNDEERAL
ncbi:MAG: rod shape-determining protein MreD [Comamonas sp.]|nr:rod shape-determining protein MreD [Comamonas sp.]